MAMIVALAGVLAAGGPAAAVTGALSLSAQSASPGDSWVQMTATAKGVIGKKIILQMQSGATWKTVQSSDWTVDFDGEEIVFDHVFTDSGSKTFRAALSSGTTVSRAITVASPIPTPHLKLTATAPGLGATFVSFNVLGNGLEGHQVRLQVLRGSTWATVGTSEQFYGHFDEEIDLEDELTSSGKFSYRAVAFQGTTAKSVSNIVTVTSSIPMPSLKLTVQQPTQWDTFASFNVQGRGLAGKSVSLQVLQGTAWKTVATSGAFDDPFDAQDELSHDVTAPGKFSYRVVALSGSKVATVSNTVVVLSSIPMPTLKLSSAPRQMWENQASFTVVGSGLLGQAPVLQRLVGKTWTKVGSGERFGDHFAESVELDYKLTGNGTHSFRAVILSGTSVKHTSPILKLAYHAPTKPKLQLVIPDKKINVAFVKVSDGRGLTVKLMQIAGKDVTLWKASKPATASNYTLRIPFKLAKAANIELRAEGAKPGQGTAYSSAVGYRAVAGKGPSKPFVSIHASGQQHNPKKTLKIQGDLPKGGVLSVQALKGKTWKQVWTRKIATEGYSASASFTLPKEGTVALRAIVTRAGKIQATSKATTAKYTRKTTKGYLGGWGNLFQDAEGNIASGDRRSDSVQLSYVLSARTAYLQQYRGGKWKNVQKVTLKKGKYGDATGRFTTPKEAATVSVKYRVRVSETAYEKPWTSPSTKIKHMNPKHYKGYIKTAHDYMKRYCPNQVVVYAPKRFGGQLNYTSTAWYPSYRIEMSPNYSKGGGMKFVALHECAHIRTYKLAVKLHGENGMDKMEARLNKIYGRNNGGGSEQVADCMAKTMGGDIRNAGYTKNCSGNRGTAAKRILAGKMP
ncbi:hypothetical protein DQ353_19080 [Arthrobacter sp. AQ5-05]|nr:hypothetical protein DQ353_19080 [Arthrobacter sp. AQ5-05]